MIIPPKLKAGDHVRVVSPATSLAYISLELRQIAHGRLAQLGLSVSYSEHAEERDRFDSSSVSSRLADLHTTFADPDVDGIMTTLGGYNSNQLLHLLDYDFIQAHPKVFYGYSDITALSNAIYARIGLVSYSAPHFSTLAMLQGLEYTDVFVLGKQMAHKCMPGKNNLPKFHYAHIISEFVPSFPNRWFQQSPVYNRKMSDPQNRKKDRRWRQ